MSSENRFADHQEIGLAVSDPSQLAALGEWLRDVPHASVQVSPGQPGPGELGATDVLTVLASSSGLIAAIRVLPEFIRSRRSGFRIETTVGGKKFVLDATNTDNLIQVIETLLHD